MKNKILKILTLSAVLVLSLCFILACDKGNKNNNGDSVHEHDYKEQVYYATCESAGVTVYTCACGDTYTQEIQPLGHNYIHGYCSNCGAKDPSAQTHTHNYTASVVYPTCIDDGSAICTCTCGESYGVVIPALNHVVVIDNRVEPTCTQIGLTEGRYCERCGEVFAEQEIIDALGHNYDDSNQCGVCDYIDTQYFSFTFSPYGISCASGAREGFRRWFLLRIP